MTFQPLNQLQCQHRRLGGSRLPFCSSTRAENRLERKYTFARGTFSVGLALLIAIHAPRPIEAQVFEDFGNVVPHFSTAVYSSTLAAEVPEQVLAAAAVIQPATDNTVAQAEITEESQSPPAEFVVRYSGTRHSAEWVGQQAASRAPLGNMMRADAKADRAVIARPNKKEKASQDLRNRLQEYRIARQVQISASQAMAIHYGLATIEALQGIQTESHAELTLQQTRIDSAIEKGISILDPSAIARLRNSLYDRGVESESQAAQLRSQLSLLVGTSIACNYLPESMELPPCPAPTINACDYLTEAYSRRCDLLGLIYLRNNLTVDTLDVARWMTDILSTSAPSGFSSGAFSLRSIFKALFLQRKADEEAELCARLAVIDQAIVALRASIGSDVDIAIEKQREAAERYCNALHRIELWRSRLEQLRKYGDQFKPLPEEESEAISNWFEARGDAVQRQGDWHRALVELSLAIGVIP